MIGGGGSRDGMTFFFAILIINDGRGGVDQATS